MSRESSPASSQVQRNRDEVMRRVFFKHYRAACNEVPFTMDDIRAAIREVAAENPAYRENNVADVRYQYASGRRPLPEAIDALGPWMIAGRGKARYARSPDSITQGRHSERPCDRAVAGRYSGSCP